MSITTITMRKWLGLALLCLSVASAASCSPCDRRVLSHPDEGEFKFGAGMTEKTCSVDADCMICPPGAFCYRNGCVGNVPTGDCGCVMGRCAYFEAECHEDQLE
jgi:hypothetical protein